MLFLYRMRYIFHVFPLLLVCIGYSPARGAEPVGLVKVATGAATVERAGTSARLDAGSDLLSEDILSTGPDGAVGITLRDDTTLSMGPMGRLVIDSFVFEPAEDQLGLDLGLLKGTFAVASGQIAKLAPEKVRVRTPSMVIGIRGTSFLVEVEGDE